MRTSKKGGRGSSWGTRAVAETAAAPAPVLAPGRSLYQAPTGSQRSLAGVVVRSIGWFVVFVALFGGGFMYWRHTHKDESAISIGTFFLAHSTAFALGVLLAVLIGSALATWSRVTAAAFGLLAAVVVATAFGGGAYIYVIQSVHDVTGGQRSKQLTQAEKFLKGLPKAGKPAVALIAGYDQRSGSGNNPYQGSNSDTLMLLRADPKTQTLSLLSFPRDLNVPIYCHGDTVYTHERINTAWSTCGVSGALLTIEHLTGMKVIPNFLITLDFRGFKQVVNKLDGVYLNVDRRYYNKNIGTYDTNYSNIDLHPGYQRLDGGQALSYVRFRHLDSDIYRNGRQQLFMDALKQRLSTTVTSASSLQTILGILGAVKRNLAVETSGGGDVPPSVITEYLGLLLGLQPGHVLRNAIAPSELVPIQVGYPPADELKASDAAIATAVNSFLHPKVPVAKHPHTAKGPKIPAADVSVLVLNGGNIDGAAAKTTTQLHKKGYDTRTMSDGTEANAPRKTVKTVIYFDGSQADGARAAQQIAPLFGSHTRTASMTRVIVNYAGKASGPLLVVVLGTKYDGTVGGGSSSGGSKGLGSTAGALVSSGLSLTLPAIRHMNGAAHFPLMLPKKIATGSTFNTAETVRLFKPIHGKQELVLTFYGPGSFDYWQIEESNWTSVPLLAKDAQTFVYGHRTYYEYTDGGKIHVIAVRDKTNVYWVTNTILNDLSNPTMIAIAEGLVPFGKH